MATYKAKFNKTLRLIIRGIAKRRIPSSALSTGHRKAAPEKRKLVLIDSFHGYECSCCGCRFPETAVRDGVSPFEKRRLAKVLREKQFLEHACSEHGKAQFLYPILNLDCP